MDVRHVKASYNRKCFINTVVGLTCGQEDLRMKWIDRQLTHGSADSRKITFIIECTQIIKLL